jgi:hypothetical protein
MSRERTHIPPKFYCLVDLASFQTFPGFFSNGGMRVTLYAGRLDWDSWIQPRPPGLFDSIQRQDSCRHDESPVTRRQDKQRDLRSPGAPNGRDGCWTVPERQHSTFTLNISSM